MFEAITIRRNPTSDTSFNIGSIAEALLFYQNVHIVFDYIDLFTLVKQIGIENLSELLSLHSVKATYLANLPVTTTTFQDKQITHKFGLAHLGDPRTGRSNPRKLLTNILASRLNSSRRTRKLVNGILEKIYVQEFVSTVGSKGDQDLLWQATSDLEDAPYVQALALLTLKDLAPSLELNPAWYFRVATEDSKFVIDTNIDFGAINRIYLAMPSRMMKGYQVTPEGPLSREGEGKRTTWRGRTKAQKVDETRIDPTTLIGAVLETRLNLMLAFNNMTEFMIAPTEAKMMRTKLSQVFQRRDKSESEIEIFRQLTFAHGRSLKDAMNSGERSFSELLQLLNEAGKFKNWLHELHPDDKLGSQYLGAVTSVGWLDRLPPKALRFALFTGAGLLADLVLLSWLGKSEQPG